ncbi:MAG TPA: M48 family metallopeptidase [Planctomycetota bacterium]|nr:M48 family metallopeptidase [Planctomycetota bacterium]
MEFHEIVLEGRRVPYRLRRSDRARWVHAEIGLRTGLRVTLPAALDASVAETFLRSRRRWVVRVLGRFERLAQIVPDRTLAHGTPVPYLGRELRLELLVGETRVECRGEILSVRLPRRVRGTVARTLEGWYREEAGRIFEGWARDLGRRHDLAFRRIVIGDQKRRWGTCYTNGTLSFNWRLMLAPEAVARYLVAHELSHVAVQNHSDRFWAKVEELCPGYEESERWLRKLGASLVL